MQPASEEGWKEDAQRGTPCFQGRDAAPRGRLEALTWQSKQPLCPVPAAREPSHPRDCPLQLQGCIHWLRGTLPTNSREGRKEVKDATEALSDPFLLHHTSEQGGSTSTTVTSLCIFCSIFPNYHIIRVSNICREPVC